MSDEKTSQLAAASTLAGTELVGVVQGGVSKQTTAAAIAALAASAGAGPSLLTDTVTGSGIGGTAVVLAQVNVPAKAYAYMLDAAAFYSGQNSLASDVFRMAIKVDAVLKGAVREQHEGAAGVDRFYAIPCITPVSIPIGATPVVTVEMIRLAGGAGGVLDATEAGVLVVKLYPT